VSDRWTRTAAWANDDAHPQRCRAVTTVGGRVPARSVLERRAGVVDYLSDLHEVDRGFDAVQPRHAFAHFL